MKVLIVEDDLLQADALKQMIRAWGHEAEAVVTGEKAVQAVCEQRRDLILMDVYLPDMTAMELIPMVRAIQPDARIITLTGQSCRELELRLRELGIAYYMAKPFAKDELFSLLSHAAGRSDARAQRRRGKRFVNQNQSNQERNSHGT
jgi:DNA-binding response OmpR family regulator